MPTTPKAAQGATSVLRREGDILSFRSLYLDIGEVDVQTDGALHNRICSEHLLMSANSALACLSGHCKVLVALPACTNDCGPDSVG